MEQNQNGLSQFGLSDKALSLLAKLEEQERDHVEKLPNPHHDNDLSIGLFICIPYP